MDRGSLGKLRCTVGLLARGMKVWVLGLMSRSKCGSVLSDHFAVIAMSCKKPMVYFTKNVAVILFLQ